MTTDPDEHAPQDPLPEVPMIELIERARSVADNSSLMLTRGALMVSMRARGLSWRQIEAQTGIPQANARRWARIFIDRSQS